MGKGKHGTDEKWGFQQDNDPKHFKFFFPKKFAVFVYVKPI